ncbi:putative immunoglobulin-blocking virulence protein [Mycoplasma sp. Ms02]|uniref:putative immunoglobulin-blocking virulence protein n=1 Tax=Mycoplasma sp. Ms02 TaxID=353851 RepID=UPI001C88F09F|nr:putative immunoglobulin-blocking virulence protein [Mycoplasma sp. Ms02]QZE12321.1 putative immunoglobulin-blocking virulence protein [Mycoplasma sp. Ms02]
MIKIKKHNLLIIASTSLIVAASVAGISAAVYIANANNQARSKDLIFEREIRSKIATDVNIEIQNKSNKDNNLPKNEKEVEITIVFVNRRASDAEIKRVVKKFNEKDLQGVNIVDLMPDPLKWSLANGDINLEAYDLKKDHPNIIPLVPASLKTKLVYVEGTKVVFQILKETGANDRINPADHLPANYRFVDDTPDPVVIGQENVYKVEKIINKIKTNIIYSFEGSPVKTISVETIEGQPIDYKTEIPAGYKLKEGFEKQPEPGKDFTVLLDKLVNKVTTTVVFENFGSFIGSSLFSDVEEGVDLDVTNRVPSGYKLSDTQSSTIKAINGQVTVRVVQIPKEIEPPREEEKPLQPIEEVDDQPIFVDPFPEPEPQPDPAPPAPEPDPAPEPEPVPEPDPAPPAPEPEPVPPKPAPAPAPEPAPAPPTPEPAPVKPVLDQAAISAARSKQGTYRESALKDLDFRKLKPDPKPSSLTTQQANEIDAITNELSDIARINTRGHKFTQSERDKIINAITRLHNINPDPNMKPNLTPEELRAALDRYVTYIENDGKSTPEKLKSMGVIREDWAGNPVVPADAFNLWIDQLKATKYSNRAEGLIPILDFTGYGTGGGYAHADISKNVVRNKMIADNKKKTFSNATEWHRNPGQIANGNYPGWSKTDVIKEYESFGASWRNGIVVERYTPNHDNQAVSNKNQQITVVTLYANYPEGYNNFLNFIDQAKKAGKPVDAITIKNIGLKNENQEFHSILSKLPQDLLKVSLFFEGYNTSSLIGLKDLRIKEMEIFTSKRDNVTSPRWSIDPNALRNVEYISFDYTNLSTVANDGARASSSIVFQTLKFSPGSTLTDINNGLKLAFVDKSDQRVFQGYWGDGGWPDRLDFSETKQIRNLKGMNLYDRVFKYLKLYNNSETFTVTLNDLTEQQWKALLLKGPSKAELDFTNNTNTLYLKGSVQDLKSQWGIDLYGLFQAGKNIFRTVYVDDINVLNLIKSSQAAGELQNAQFLVKPDGFDPEQSTGGGGFSGD